MANKNVNKVAEKALTTTKNTAKKAGRFVMDNPKTVVYITIGAAAAFAIYKLIQGVSAAGEGIKKVGKEISGENIDNNIEIIQNIDPAKLTINQEKASKMAAQLLTAMNWKTGVFPLVIHGTDTDLIKGIFSKITGEDFKLIYNAFGKKYYNGFGSPPENIIGGIHDLIEVATEEDLVYWLKNEIDSFWDKTVYNQVKNIVEQAGFAF